MWIEIIIVAVINVIGVSSRPVRALWIEMIDENPKWKIVMVDAREGLVD